MVIEQTLSLHQVELIDQLCKRFEDVLKKGERPDLSGFLTQVDEPMRPVLCRELILLAQVHLPGQALDHYRHALPQFRHLFDAPAGAASASNLAVTLPNLLQVLETSAFLDLDQRRELRQQLAEKHTTVKTLLGELVRRDWLTAFQANRLAQGRLAELVLGPYVLLECLGKGGMGQVFKAKNTHFGRLVAVKLLRTERLADPSVRRRFRREIRAVAQLDHPNIVRALDADEVGGICFLVMDYVDGMNLHALVERDGPLAVEWACDYVRQAALGLQHAHERGLIHRDIKPGNLLLDRAGGAVKVLDLGLARFEYQAENGPRKTDDTSSDTVTREGTAMGTPDFMAPEQALDARLADGRSDLYSLGATLFFLLTGRPPVGTGSLAQKIDRLLSMEPVSVRALRPDTPESVALIMGRLLAKRPEDRFASAAELIRALETWQDPPAPVVVAPQAAESDQPREESFSRLATVEIGVLIRPPRESKRGLAWWYGLAAVGIGLGFVALMAVLAAWLSGGSPPDKGDPPIKIDAPGLTVLQRLNAEDIPAAERFPWQPKELVAVLGNHERRHWGRGTVVAFRPDGKRFASGGADGLVHIWNAADGRLERTHDPADKRFRFLVTSLAFAPDGELTARYWDGSTRSWTADGQPLPKFDIPNRVVAFAYSHKTSKLAIAWNDRTIHLIDRTSGGRQIHAKLRGHKDEITCLDFSADDTLLISGSKDATVRLWDTAQGTPVQTLELPNAQATSVVLSHDNKILIATNTQQNAIAWERMNSATSELRKAKEFTGLGAPAVPRFSPDGRWLIMGINQGVVIFDTKGFLERRRLLTARVGSLAYSPDGTSLVSGGDDDGAIRMWDTESWQERFPLAGNVGVVPAVSFAPDGSALAWVGSTVVAPSVDQNIFIETAFTVWDLRAAQARLDHMKTIPWREGKPYYNTVIPSFFAMLDENRVATIDRGAVQYWNVKEEAIERRFSIANNDFIVAAFSKDRKHLGAVRNVNDNALDLWRLETDSLVEPRRWLLDGAETTRSTPAVAFSPDGATLSIGEGARIRHWEVAKGKQLPEWKTEHKVLSLAYSSTGRVAAGTPQEILLWDGKGGNAPKSLFLPDPQAIRRVVFSPDGRFLAAHDEHGRVAWWEVSRAAPNLLGSWKAPGFVEGFAALDFAADNLHLAVGNANGTVYILRITAF